MATPWTRRPWAQGREAAWKEKGTDLSLASEVGEVTASIEWEHYDAVTVARLSNTGTCQELLSTFSGGCDDVAPETMPVLDDEPLNDAEFGR